MAGGESFNMAEEFADVDFNEARLEKRLRGYAIEKLQERDMEKTKSLILWFLDSKNGAKTYKRNRLLVNKYTLC